MKTKRNLLILLIIFYFSVDIHAQSPIIVWQKCLGGSKDDYASSIQQTNDKGYIIAGFTKSNDGNISGNHGGSDFWIVKIDNSGNIQWQKCLGGSKDDYATSIQQTSDGGFIIAGYTCSKNGDILENHGGSDFWIVKIDNSGNIQWQKCLGGSKDDYATSIQQTSDGSFIIAGYTCSNNRDVSGNHGDYDCWIVKINDIGNIQWQKCLGGSSSDRAESIQQTSDGGFIMTGRTGSNDGDVLGNHGGQDYWVVKLNNIGNIQWQKCLGGSSSDWVHSIQQTSDGGFIVAGETWSNDGDVSGMHGDDDYWVVKLDNSGNIKWQKCLGGSKLDYATSVQQTNDGGYIISGYTVSNDGDVSKSIGSVDAWAVKLDNSGNIQWEKSFGGTNDDRFSSILQINDGFVATGRTYSNDINVSGNHGEADYWIMKIK